MFSANGISEELMFQMQLGVLEGLSNVEMIPPTILSAWPCTMQQYLAGRGDQGYSDSQL